MSDSFPKLKYLTAWMPFLNSCCKGQKNNITLHVILSESEESIPLETLRPAQGDSFSAQDDRSSERLQNNVVIHLSCLSINSIYPASFLLQYRLTDKLIRN